MLIFTVNIVGYFFFFQKCKPGIQNGKKKCFHDLRNSEDLLFFSLQDFQNEMSSKQPEIDQLTKSDRRRSQSVSGEPVSHIPMFKGLSGRRTPTPVKYGRYVKKNIVRACQRWTVWCLSGRAASTPRPLYNTTVGVHSINHVT